MTKFEIERMIKLLKDLYDGKDECDKISQLTKKTIVKELWDVNIEHILNRPTLNKINIGAWWQNSVWLANGKLDDIKIYSRALSACDVNGLFNEPNPLNTVLSEEKILNTITVFSNPVENVLKISEILTAKLTLTNVSGQILKQQVYKNQFIEMDIADLNAGIYLIYIETEKEKLFKKIIKK